MSKPRPPTSARNAAALQAQIANALTWTAGPAAPPVREAFAAARELPCWTSSAEPRRRPGR